MSTNIWRILFRSGVIAIIPLLLLTGCGNGETESVDTSATVAAAVSATVEAQTVTGSTGAPPATPTTSIPPTPVPPAKVLSASASVRADNPLIVEVALTLDSEAQVYVEYENAETGKFRSMTTESVATEHAVPVVRLRPSTTYSYQVFTVDSEGLESEGPTGSFTTGALPEALASIEFSAQGRPTPELIIMDHRDAQGGYILVLDQDSEIVWYYASPNPIPDMSFGLQAIKQKPNFNLVYVLGAKLCCIREITPLGEIVDNLTAWEIDEAAHHEVLFLPDDEILYLAFKLRIMDMSKTGGDPETVVHGDSIRIWDQKSGISREVWNTFDSLSPDLRGELKPFHLGIPGKADSLLKPLTWLHVVNSIQVGQRGNYILSLRLQNQVVSISPDFQKIDWSLGGPNSTFDFPDPNDRFYHAHTASELENGNILVFDNGQGRPKEEGGSYSRALELALSDYDSTAIKVWQYPTEPGLYASKLSSAWRLENGNTLVNFGITPDVVAVPITVVEVARDGTEVWKLEMTGPTLQARYRAYAHESIFGETRLR